MKHLTIMLGVLAILVLVAGCERQLEEDDSAAYDPSIDGPQRGANIQVDPNLVADQAVISRAAVKAAEKAGETPTETPGRPAPYTPASPKESTRPDRPETQPTTRPGKSGGSWGGIMRKFF